MTIGERIVGTLVALAPLRPEDAPAWARWLSDPATTRYLYGRRGPPDAPPTLAEGRSWGPPALVDPHRRPDVLGARPDQAVVGVLLDHVRRPAHHPAHGEDGREEARVDAEVVVGRGGVEVDVRVQPLLVDHGVLDPLGHVVPAR